MIKNQSELAHHAQVTTARMTQIDTRRSDDQLVGEGRSALRPLLPGGVLYACRFPGLSRCTPQSITRAIRRTSISLTVSGPDLIRGRNRIASWMSGASLVSHMM